MTSCCSEWWPYGRFLGTAASSRMVRDVARRGRPVRSKAISMHALAEPRPANVGQPGEIGGGVGREAEVHDLRAPAQQGVGDEPPIPAVERVVPIVAQHEVLLLRDDQRPP